MTPADEIKQAADKLTALATAASSHADGTPTAHWNSEDQGHGHSLLFGDYTIDGRGERVGWPSLVRGGSFQRPSYMHTQHAAYAAAMGPTVGLALAKLLEGAAKHYDDGFLCCEHGADSCSEVVAPALAVARAINGPA